MTCCFCTENKVESFLNLGHQPPSDAFLRQSDLEKPEMTFPLEVGVCTNCFLVQLNYVVDPELMFRDYVYTSGTNNSLRINFKNLVETIVSRFNVTKNDLAVDIGANDGTLLENYLPHGIKVLGIDPASVTEIAIKKGLPIMVDFFNEQTATKAKDTHGAAKIITATNVFAHVADLDSFMRGIVSLLSDDGVFVSESHYLLDMIEQMQYDAVYHEHLRYYSLKPLNYLFAKYGMEIIDAERISTHGGSIRVYAAQKGTHPVSENVAQLIAAEEKAGLYTISTYQDYGKKVQQTKRTLLDLIVKLRQQGKRIVGIGAPAKGNTLLNYCRLDVDLIDYLVEKSDLKIGLYAPGTHIPVVGEEKLFTEQPEYGLLLSWNIAEELVPKIKNAGFKGQFIVPNPEPRIL